MGVLRLKEEEEETRKKAKDLHVFYISLVGFPIDKEALAILPEGKARVLGTIIFYKEDKLLHLGSLKPESSEVKQTIEKLEKEKGLKAKIFLISQSSFNWAIKVYRQIVIPKKIEKEKIEVTKEELPMALGEVKKLTGLRERVKEISITKLISDILAGALVCEASDVHLEPEEKDIKLRYRIDGVLQDMAVLHPVIYPKILSRIKLQAGMKINITNIPQDGRFTIELDQKKIDLRISTLPSGYGETVVIRLLGVGAVSLKIEDLGLSGRASEIIKEGIDQPNGIILTTGPTGSGKTTTLYSFLNTLKNPEIKIITLENPIEYKIPGIIQTQIDPEAGLTFPVGLRAILRQDPDVIMIGEIRDLDTAETAAQAALTGHLVFSTLHTNDVAGVIPRLDNIGVRPHILAPALRVAIAQRLVRKLCQKCKQSYKPDKNDITKLKEKLGKHFPKEGIKTLYKAKGCSTCHGTGYKGRLGVFEVFKIDRKVEDLINKRASSLEITEHVIKDQGMVTMEQDGLLKAIRGITSLDEVERVT
jgi:type IV pilus assembly protein PilB